VPYNEIPDFWWSGHIGLCMLNLLEFWTNGVIFWAIYSAFVMIFTFFTMIFIRGHYTVDMISGFIIAHFFFIISEKYIYIFDWFVFGIPLR